MGRSGGGYGSVSMEICVIWEKKNKKRQEEHLPVSSVANEIQLCKPESHASLYICCQLNQLVPLLMCPFYTLYSPQNAYRGAVINSESHFLKADSPKCREMISSSS